MPWQTWRSKKVSTRFVSYEDDQWVRWRRANTWPIIWLICPIVLLICIFVGFIQGEGNASVSLILAALTTGGFLFAYIMRRPRMGLYLATASFMFDSRGIPGPINLSPSNILLIFILVAVVLKWLHYRSRNVDKASLLLGSGLLIAAFTSLFVAKFPGTVLRLMITITSGLIILFLTQVLMSRSSDLAHLVKAYTVGAGICALLGVIQGALAKFAGIQYGRLFWCLGGSGAGEVIKLSMPRVTSTWLDPNIFGLFLVPAVPFTWAVFPRGWKRHLLMAILLSGMALSYSRSAWIAAIVAVLVTIGVRWLSQESKRADAPAEVVRLYLLLFVMVILMFSVVRLRIWDRLISMNVEAYERRIEMSLIGWRYYLASPVFGVGPGNFLKLSNVFTHNSYLSVLIEYGTIGGLAWFSLLLLTAWRGLKLTFQSATFGLRRLSIASLGAFAGVLVGGLSIEIQNAKFVWLTIAIITAMTTRFSTATRSNPTNREEARA